MSRLSLIPPAACAAFMAAAAIAHAQTPSPAPKSNDTLPAPTEAQREAIKQLPDKIKDKLTAEGFSDVTVVPGSFIVSGRDKDGKPVMMLIGPNSMQIMTTGRPGDDESIAQSPMDDDHDATPGDIGKGQVIQQ